MSNLERLRRARKMNQGDVAARVGIAVSTYSQYENGLRSVPIDLAAAIATVVGCSMEDIFLPTKFTVSESAAAG